MNCKILILHDIRSAHNVGSILRTAECFGVKDIYITGYTPYPRVSNDSRLPHIVEKLHKDIIKTSLGAEKNLNIIVGLDIDIVINTLKKKGIRLIAAEQDQRSQDLGHYNCNVTSALIVGREVEGIDKTHLQKCDDIVEIPMRGTKESFNVAVATGIVLYQFACKS